MRLVSFNIAVHTTQEVRGRRPAFYKVLRLPEEFLDKYPAVAIRWVLAHTEDLAADMHNAGAQDRSQWFWWANDSRNALDPEARYDDV